MRFLTRRPGCPCRAHRDDGKPAGAGALGDFGPLARAFSALIAAGETSAAAVIEAMTAAFRLTEAAGLTLKPAGRWPGPV